MRRCSFCLQDIRRHHHRHQTALEFYVICFARNQYHDRQSLHECKKQVKTKTNGNLSNDQCCILRIWSIAACVCVGEKILLTRLYFVR